MCGMCPDTIGSCAQLECGARPRLDEEGNPRYFYMRHFVIDEIPCEHVLMNHGAECRTRRGLPCDCWDDDFEDYPDTYE